MLWVVEIMNKRCWVCYCSLGWTGSAATGLVAALLELGIVEDKLLAALARVHSTLHFLVTAHIIYLLH